MPDPRLDSQELSNLQVLGVARSQALAVSYQSLAQSLSMLMHNAVAAQQSAATVTAAIVTMTARRLVTGQLDVAQPQPQPTEGDDHADA